MPRPAVAWVCVLWNCCDRWTACAVTVCRQDSNFPHRQADQCAASTLRSSLSKTSLSRLQSPNAKKAVAPPSVSTPITMQTKVCTWVPDSLNTTAFIMHRHLLCSVGNSSSASHTAAGLEDGAKSRSTTTCILVADLTTQTKCILSSPQVTGSITMMLASQILFLWRK